MNLPIEQIPHTTPPQFRWQSLVDGPTGRQLVVMEGCVQPSMERALERMITIARHLMKDNAGLQGKVDGLTKELQQVKGQQATQLQTATPTPQNKKGK